VKLVDRIFDPRPTSLQDVGRAVEVNADLAQRTGPMGLLACRQAVAVSIASNTLAIEGSCKVISFIRTVSSALVDD
jgi:hypothetical protein